MSEWVTEVRRAADIDLYWWSYAEFVDGVVSAFRKVHATLAISALILIIVCLIGCLAPNAYQVLNFQSPSLFANAILFIWDKILSQFYEYEYYHIMGILFHGWNKVLKLHKAILYFLFFFITLSSFKIRLYSSNVYENILIAWNFFFFCDSIFTKGFVDVERSEKYMK